MEGSDEIVDPNTGIPLGELAEESRNSSPTLETRRNRKKRKAALLNTKVGVLVHSSTHPLIICSHLEVWRRRQGGVVRLMVVVLVWAVMYRRMRWTLCNRYL
jgi:hypothetical protein